MPSSEKIAIAAHLHVLLRRKTGRVTDTEWMATNQEYAAEITRFAREKAVEDGHADLAAWADKLEEIMAMPGSKAQPPFYRGGSDTARDRGVPTVSSAPVPDRQSSQSVDTHDEVYPESGFIESTFGSIFGEGDPNKDRKPRDPNGPRYVKGLR